MVEGVSRLFFDFVLRLFIAFEFSSLTRALVQAGQVPVFTVLVSLDRWIGEKAVMGHEKRMNSGMSKAR